MIQANELRIGNWVFGHDPQAMAHGEQRYFQIDEISEVGINCWRVDGFSDEYAEAEPIPLTHEILEKCGFKAEENVEQDGQKWMHYHLETERFNFLFNSDGSSYDLECGAGWSIIHNLHQLQNLYFALTGTELIYTP